LIAEHPAWVRNFQVWFSNRAQRAKKAYERSEFRVAFDLAFVFIKVTKILTKNCPDESSESEIQ
jgi:hypothetical protein